MELKPMDIPMAHARLETLRPPGFALRYEAWQSGTLNSLSADQLSKELIRLNSSLLALLPAEEREDLGARPLPHDPEELVRILTDVEETLALKIATGELQVTQLPHLDWCDVQAQGIP